MSGPNIPAPISMQLSKETTAILVLDVNAECENPETSGSRLLDTLGSFLARARDAHVPILYTISLTRKGTPMGNVAAPLGYREGESILYPDAFDKFSGGDLKNWLNHRKIQNLVIVGRSTNVAVMYTATAAVRVHGYTVILPIDGMNANSDYEHEYALHQLANLPKKVTRPITLTELGKLSFQ